MIILPAIDLYKGKVVRLTKGNFDDRVVYGDDPYSVAKSFKDAGCTHIHIVDLEGAQMGYPRHLDILSKIGRLGLFTEYGGGLRSRAAITDAIRAGAWRVMVGSILFNREDMAKELFQTFGFSLMPALDVSGNKVVISGWYQSTGMTPQACLAKLYSAGYRTFLVTSVESDGMLQGPDIEIYKPLVGDTTNIVAAGGVTTLDDIMKLKEIGVSGAVVGKAIYEKSLDLGEALQAAKD
ncbi:MAG: 1-(5-phosphoribosyl)-5-[(5-phosphoribosylamino)methylideneamino] imidazole-4-carboxamide isomerase [Synergistaceae bacterium]|nr:1-(5-phosphoribosyl)-5-[(5-phosphoribosylamino)methylideneamino] imidazole-4-carboxamide isomerase [Synergistaceae bacterium]